MAARGSILVAEAVTKTYGREQALGGVDLSVRKGEVVALIGPSGGGKSTFLRCINHLERITSGKLLVFGENIGYKRRGNRLYEQRGRALAESRSRIGMVFQQFNLFQNMNVLENITLGPILVKKVGTQAAKVRALELLERVGLAGKMGAYPRELSGGQQQRVAIARALAMDPELLLFDEPTSALDPELVGEVLDIIADLAKEGRTMLIATHEIGFARQVANRVAFFSQGRVEELGPPTQVIDAPQNARTAQFLSRLL